MADVVCPILLYDQKEKNMFRKIFSIALVLSCVLLAVLITSPHKVSAALPAAGSTTTTTPTAAPKPDLIISSVVGQQKVLDANGCALSRNNTLNVTIQNVGAVAASVFEVSATGRNRMFQAVPSLAAGASITLIFADLPTDSVNVITVDSTGLVAESQEGNNVSNFNSPTLSPMCTATPTPIGFKTPTATRTGTPPCMSSGVVRFNHIDGAGMVNVPIIAANNTGTPNPGMVATTGPYGQFTAGCMAGKAVYGQLSGFTFNPTVVNVSSSFTSNIAIVANVFAMPSYTPTGMIITSTPSITPTPVSTNNDVPLPDLRISSITYVGSTPACMNNPRDAVTVINSGAVGAGTFVVSFASQTQTVSSLGAGQTVTLSFAVGSPTTAIADSTNVIMESNESNNSLTVSLGAPTQAPTCTPTGGPSLTPTRTPTITITRTPTITPTTGVGVCSPVTSSITVPFTFDGAGMFCWQASNLGGFINSWNTTSVTLNGVNVSNVYLAAGAYPAKINGFYYVGYNSSVAWGHFEAKP